MVHTTHLECPVVQTEASMLSVIAHLFLDPSQAVRSP